MRNTQHLILPFAMVAAVLLASCATTKTSDPPRTATEQLLLSTATDHALRTSNLAAFAGRKVFLDPAYFDSYDSKYVLGTIRDALSRAGALLEDNASNSDIIMEARSGGLSTDSSDSLFGIPTMAVPIPLAGPLQIPEVAFYLSHKQKSYAKIALLAFARQSRAHIYSSGPLDGKAHDEHNRFLFFSWVRTDIPEKQTSEAKTADFQSWLPQYDLANLPPRSAPGTNSAPAASGNLTAPRKASTNAPCPNAHPCEK